MKQYHNFKNYYSVVLLALVDAKYQFMWAALSASGNTHDSTYFQSTHVFHEINEANVLPEKFQFSGNTKIPPMILGDGAFPMKPCMCKPFGDAVLTEERLFQLSFKPCAYGIRRAFGKRESRFRVLHRKCESSKESIKAMDFVAVVLYNICLEMGDILPRSMDLTVDPATNKRGDRKEVAAILDLADRNQRNYMRDKTATAIRESLTTFFWEHKGFKENNKVV